MKIDTNTRLCAVIGDPVAHSLSPAMHNAAFAAAGLNYVYLAFHVQDVAHCLAGMRALKSFRGMSVTIPHKVAVMEHLDEIDPMAVEVGCVNTITNQDGCLIGSITDGTGTLRAFSEAGVELEGKRVLFLGAGGAVRAVAFAMAAIARPASITVLGRSPNRLDSLVNDLRGQKAVEVAKGSIEEDLAEALPAHDVLVQGTPVGMHGHDEGRSCVPKALLRDDLVVFDMVYRPLKTRLIQEAEDTGCTTMLGLEMLLHQAVLQFETWTGVNAPQTAMREALAGALEAEGTV